MTNTAIDRGIKIGGYEFSEKEHVHKLDGKNLTGVTTVLSVIAKPALIQWSANMACDYIQEYVLTELQKDGGKGGELDDYEPYIAITDDEGIAKLHQIIKEARTAHRKKKETAGEFGSIIHDAIEKWIKEGTEPVLEDTQLKAFNHFKAWAEDNNVKFLESEKHVYSRELWVGGICDLVFEMGGKKYIGDIKTSSGIYREAFFQMGAYDLCLNEMGQDDFEGYVVINLTKKGTIETQTSYGRDENKNAFKSALTLYRTLNQYK